MCNCKKIGNAAKTAMQSFNEGRVDDALLELKEALALAETLGTPIHQAKIRVNLALVLNAGGLADEARTQLRSALHQVEGKIGTNNPLHASITRQLEGLAARPFAA